MQKKTEAALRKIENSILNGDVGASGFLPSERELCRQLEIGRGALRAVFDELIRRKRLCHVPGKGMKLLFHDGDSPVMRKYILVMPSTGARTGEVANILCGAASAAAELNAELLLFFTKSDCVGKQLAAHISSGTCDGMIFLDRLPHAMKEALEKASLRYVVANCEEEGSLLSVKMDLRGVGRLAGRYLVENGMRSIGFIGGGTNHYIYREMFAGHKGALAEDDLAPAKEMCRIFEGTASPEEIASTVEEILRQAMKKTGPRAIFAGRDHWARHIWEAAEKQGVKIPGDISVMGYDNVSWPDGRLAGLTTIEQPAFAIGETAIKLLAAAAESGQPVGSASISSGEIIERTSVKVP